MANNYIQTSFILNCLSKENAEDVMAFAEALTGDGEHPDVLSADDPDMWCGGDISVDGDDGAMWFRDNGESFDTDYFVEVIAYAMKKYKLEPMGFTFACTCSKQRLDEFDGGAIFFKLGDDGEVKTKYVNGWSWLEEQKTAAKK